MSANVCMYLVCANMLIHLKPTLILVYKLVWLQITDVFFFKEWSLQVTVLSVNGCGQVPTLFKLLQVHVHSFS